MERNDPLRRGFKNLEPSFALALRDRCAWVDCLDQPPPLILSREDVQAFLCGGESGSGGGGGAGAAAPLPLALQPGGAAAAPSPAASLVSSVAALRGEDLPFPGAAAQLARLRALGGGGGGPPPPPSAVQARLAAALERPSDAGDDPPRPPPPQQQLVEPPPLPPAHAAYRRFVARLKEPAAVDVAYAIREWLKQFCARDFPALYKQLPDEDAFMFAGEDDGGQEEEVEEQEKGEAPPPPPPQQQQQQQQLLQQPPPLGGAGTEAAPVTAFAPRAPARAPRPPSPAEQFHGFLSSLEATLRSHPLWRGESGAAREATLEAAERFVAAGFHARLHCAHPRSARRDAALARRLAALSFVTHAHLDLPPPSARTARGWRLAQAALSAMADFAAPADKLRCIMNACVVLVGVLAAAAEEAAAAKAAAAAAARGAAGGSGGSGGSANAAEAVRAPSSPSAGASFGADDFLPALIFTVIHAGPRTRGLYSCLRVISEFRPPAKLNGEEGYFFTNIVSAVQFCKNPRLNPAAGGGGGAQPSPAGAAARAEGTAEFLAMLEAGGGLPQQRLQQQQKQQQQANPLPPLLAPPPLSPKEAGERLRAALQRTAREVAVAGAAARRAGAARSLDDAPAALQGLLRARSRLLRALAE